MNASASNNTDIYYLFSSDTIVCGIAEALHLPENVLQKLPAATPNDKRYGNHAKKILGGLEMRAEPTEPLEQIVGRFIQYPNDYDAHMAMAGAWRLLKTQKDDYAAQFIDLLSGEHLDEDSAKALNTALKNLQAMEVFGHLRCWQGFAPDLMTRLDGDRQLRVVRMEFNRLQLLMDGYVLVNGSRPPSERNAKHGKIAQRARSAWIQEDAQWTFSDPPGSVHLVVGNEYRPPASVLFQEPPNRPHTTLDDPRTINPPHVRRTTATSSNADLRLQSIRRPLGNMGFQQMNASTERLEELLVDLVQKVGKMQNEAQKEFSRLNKDISSLKRLTKEGVKKDQRARSPLPQLRRLSLSQLDEYGPSIPGQRPVPGPARIFNHPGWTFSEPTSPEYERSPLIYPSYEDSPPGASEAGQSPEYGPPPSSSSEINPQGASTPKRLPKGREEHHSTEEEYEGETSSGAGPSGTQ